MYLLAFFVQGYNFTSCLYFESQKSTKVQRRTFKCIKMHQILTKSTFLKIIIAILRTIKTMGQFISFVICLIKKKLKKKKKLR